MGLFTEVIPNVTVVKYEKETNDFKLYLWRYKTSKSGSAKSP